jgi:hypothetical protein
MPILNCKSTFGNFGWEASLEVTQEIADILASKGLLQILQRSPASEAEKILAGYEKRPKDFERKDIPYNEANAKVLADKLGAKHEIDEGVFIQPTLVVNFHEIGGGKEPAFKDEKVIVARHIAAGDFAQWMDETVGMKGVTAQDVDKPEVLQAVRTFWKAEYAKKLAAV